jgi:hypothetical protein
VLIHTRDDTCSVWNNRRVSCYGLCHCFLEIILSNFRTNPTVFGSHSVTIAAMGTKNFLTVCSYNSRKTERQTRRRKLDYSSAELKFFLNPLQANKKLTSSKLPCNLRIQTRHGLKKEIISLFWLNSQLRYRQASYGCQWRVQVERLVTV